MDNQFDSKGGEQNIAQGDHAIGKQENNYYGVPYEDYRKLGGQLDVTDSALASFFKILEEQQVPRSDLDSKLREIAGQYKELLLRLETVQSEDPQIVKLKEQARQAIDAGDYAKAEELLNQAEARDVQAIEQREDAAKQRRISAADTNVTQAIAQRVQLRYAKAAVYWQKAAALLPEKSKKERSRYLHEAGYDLDRIARYTEALSLYEQSLRIRQEIGFKVGEGTTLNNISQIYAAQGDRTTALKYLEQSLRIRQEVGDKAGEGQSLNNIAVLHDSKGDYDKALPLLEQSLTIFREVGGKTDEAATLNNISQIYAAQGDRTTALKYLEQSLRITQEIGDRAGEGPTLSNIGALHHTQGDYGMALKYLEKSLAISQEIGDRVVESATLNNIGEIHRVRGDYPTALKYLEQSLVITQEIGDKAGEAVTSWNIGMMIYKKRKAEPYISRAVQIAEQIGHPKLEEWRKALKRVRAKLKGR